MGSEATGIDRSLSKWHITIRASQVSMQKAHTCYFVEHELSDANIPFSPCLPRLSGGVADRVVISAAYGLHSARVVQDYGSSPGLRVLATGVLCGPEELFILICRFVIMGG